VQPGRGAACRQRHRARRLHQSRQAPDRRFRARRPMAQPHASLTVLRDDASVETLLARGRQRTLALLDPLPIADQRRQVSELMSPLCWDLAHVAHYEELWLLRNVAGMPPTDPTFDDTYDAFRHPRREQSVLAILEPDAAREFARSVR